MPILQKRGKDHWRYVSLTVGHRIGIAPNIIAPQLIAPNQLQGPVIDIGAPMGELILRYGSQCGIGISELGPNCKLQLDLWKLD